MTNKTCTRKYDEHLCDLLDCPNDDPDHIHHCFMNDFDWTEGEHHKRRLGLITEEEFLNTGMRRANRRVDAECRRGLKWPE